MGQQTGILAIFRYLDHLTDAMEKIRHRQDFAGHEVFTPTSYHEIEHAAGFAPSPVRFYTLIGGLTGVVSGFSLCLWMDYDWPLVVGGKAAGLPSIFAYVVIGFELTILLGALATILGMLIHCKIPNPKEKILDNRLTDDRFGVFVPGASKEGAQATFLKQCGADEIKSIS